MIIQTVCYQPRKSKQRCNAQIQHLSAKILNKIRGMCGKCYYKKFDTLFAISMLLICLATAIIANWIFEHFVSKLNSQMVLFIIGICLLVWIFIICFINDNHHHTQDTEPQPAPVPDAAQNQRNQENQQRIRSIIQRYSIRQCLNLLNGPIEELQIIKLNHLPYLRNIVSFSPQIGYNQRVQCFNQLDQLLLQFNRIRHQRLLTEVQVLKKRLQTLSARNTSHFQCDECIPCLLTSHTSIFGAISGLIAIGITEATAFSSSPLTMDWSPTWAIKIMFSMVSALLLFQILYRNFRSKTPYNHQFF